MADTAGQKKIKSRILLEIIQSSLIYAFLLVVILLIGYTWGHTVLWHGTERLYPLLHWMADNVVFVACVFFGIGECCIFFYYWYKIGTFFYKISESMEIIYEGNQSWVQLPEELKEMEIQMNRIKNQVQQSRQQAKEAEQRKNDLVVYLAHDLKTPLTSVMGYLMLLEEQPDLSLEMRKKYLDITINKAERLEQLINEFFEITRFNLTNIELEKRSVDFTRLLEQTIFEFQPMLKSKNLTCCLKAPKESIILVCDMDKIQRVVDNLLRNAILYGYEGTQLTVAIKKIEEKIIFTCSNYGPTIPKEKLGRVFEQFYRLDYARTSSTGGTGLGLAIAKEIVRLHGGSITAKSEEEITTFQVELPVR